MYIRDNKVQLNIALTAKLIVVLEGEESLDGFDVNQDVASLLAEDFKRWLTSGTHTKMVCEGGEQTVSIITCPIKLNVSDVTGEVKNV